jgi:hypothetical protein
VTAVAIRIPEGHPGQVTVTVDGAPITGLRRYAVEQRAGVELPVVVLELYATALDLDLPDVVLTALDVAFDGGDERDQADGGAPEGTGLPREATLRRLARAEDGQLAGLDVAGLAERYAALPDAARLLLLDELDLMDNGERAIAASDDMLLTRLDRVAFNRARERGQIPAFAAAIDTAFHARRAVTVPTTSPTTVPTDSEGAE